MSELKPYRAYVSLAEDQSPNTFMASFETGGYPKINFPCPTSGWDLSNFQGIELKVTNLSDIPVRAALRIDNPGDEKEQFWNTETRQIEPGQTVNIRSVFGQNNGRPGYPLDATRITAYQFFLTNPDKQVILQLGEPKAYGNATDEQRKERFSQPEDRLKKVQVPEWLGKRPPSQDNWTLTLDEDFEADSLNREVWSTRLATIHPHREETQRYRDGNLKIDDGVIRLTIEKNPGHQYDDPELPQRDYAAAMLSSYDLWTQRYGYFEIRAKMPTAKGLALVFGLIPDRGSEKGLNMHARRTSHDFNGQGMEMDVVQHLTEWGPGRVSFGARWGGPAGTHIQKHWGDSYSYHGQTEDGWHVYGMLWESDRLVWYIDGIKKGEWHNDAIANVPCYLSVTIPMGRRATKNVDDSNLPDHWDIDYIRVWQKNERF